MKWWLFTVAIFCTILTAFGIFQFGQNPLEHTINGTRYLILQPRNLLPISIWPLFIWVAYYSFADLPKWQLTLSVFIRVLLLALLSIGLARPSLTQEHRRVSVVYMVDVSASMDDRALIEASDLIYQGRKNARANDAVHLLVFARDAREVSLPENKETRPSIQRNGIDTSETNISSAMALAYSLIEPGTIPRFVIISDGMETIGDARSEAVHSQTLDIEIYTHLIQHGIPSEIAVTSLDFPENIQVGSPFIIRANIFSSSRSRARIRLYQGETLNGLDSVSRNRS